MLTQEFNALPLSERSTLVFSEGTLIGIFQDQTTTKGFYYKLNDLKVDVIYDRFHNQVLDIFAWETPAERKAV